MVYCMRPFFLLIFCLKLGFCAAQTDSAHMIKVWFLYGSKPKYKYRKTEKRIFGGIHSGHVSIQVGDVDYGFQPKQKPVHIFPRNTCDKCKFVDTTIYDKPRHGAGEKTAVVFVPLTPGQYKKLDSIVHSYSMVTPYDYAVFGMRCTSSASDILSQIGLLKKRSHFFTILTTFYPRKLRKRVFKLARRNCWRIQKTPGRKTRVWEKDL
jgi:hypothetical protein